MKWDKGGYWTLVPCEPGNITRLADTVYVEGSVSSDVPKSIFTRIGEKDEDGVFKSKAFTGPEAVKRVLGRAHAREQPAKEGKAQEMLIAELEAELQEMEAEDEEETRLGPNARESLGSNQDD